MEKNEQSGIPDPDDPNDPANMRSTCALETNTLKEIRAVQDKVERGNNNHLESSSIKHEKHQPNDTKIEIKQLEEILGVPLKNIHEPVRQCCIYKVPRDLRNRDLRNIDIKAYTPQVISIGPLHRDKAGLREMENQKLKYMSEFLKRAGAEKLKGFKRFIEEKEQIIRNYYQENSSLASPEFVNMILLNAVFIIELFLKNAEAVKKTKFDFFLDRPYLRATIIRDLILLENQLPYFLLKDLFVKGAFLNFTKKDYPHNHPFLILSVRFFFNSENEDFPKPKDGIQHFTDLIRYFLLMKFLPLTEEFSGVKENRRRKSPTATKQGKHVRKTDLLEQKQGKHVRYLPTATKLHGSGVKFKGIEGGSSLKISCKYVPHAIRIPYFKSCQLPIPYYKACELRIPCFVIDDWSECLYRNMIALELCHYPDDTHICNFILLMNFLIDSEKDVDLLVDQGIIISHLGDNATVATMFNKLGFQITPSPFCLP